MTRYPRELHPAAWTACSMVNGEWSVTGPARVRPDAICRVRLDPVVWGLIFLSLACHPLLNQSSCIDGLSNPCLPRWLVLVGKLDVAPVVRCGPRIVVDEVFARSLLFRWF